MFYAIEKEGTKAVMLAEWNKKRDCIGYVTLQELAQQEEALKISAKTLEECVYEQARFRMGLKYYDTFGFAMLKLLQIRDVEQENAYLAFFMRDNLFVFVEIKDPQGTLRGRFCQVLEKEGANTTLEKVVFEFFETFLQEGNGVLEETEQVITDMERHVVEGTIDKELNKRIFEWKRRLALQKNYYQQLCNVGTALMENENKIFWKEDMNYFKLFTDQAQSLQKNTQLLCEDLIHVREALDAALNYDLNSIMKVFTVVTTVFLPLTLITGWYGMNFSHMPELSWTLGYPLVVALSLAVVAGCLLFFKRKKLL